ncbi:MAG: hypothetical protein O7F71_12010 [Gammaproteobacteria bacterium]|nr:hypothetical protein [Gammaproteobacteria bacterium]
MKWIKRILGAVLALVLVFVLVVVGIFTVARFHDGPFDGGLAIVAGGAFVEGELQTGTEEPDWAFLRDYFTIEFQLLDPARSRTTFVMEHDGRIFIPSGYMNSIQGKLWKHWPKEAEEDGRALLRVDGKIYERQLVRIQEGDIVLDVLAVLGEKYGEGPAAPLEMVTSGDLWLFELEPRN